MTFPYDIFKAYDIRGKVGSELNDAVATQVGKALADWLPTAGAIAVGYDMRPDSKALAEALVRGARAQGRNIIDIGNVASDMIYFAVGSLELAGGAMVTASHNPGDDNGIKLCQRAAEPIGIESGLLELRDLAEKHDDQLPSNLSGKLTQQSVLDAWIEHALDFVDTSVWPNYTVVVDAGNGMAGAVIPSLEAKVPLVIDPLYFELDGTFPNHIANPLVPENLLDAQARIREIGADFGIAFDGDGDRAVVLDEHGEPLSGTVTTALLARYFLGREPGATILYNAVCGRAVPDVVAEYGGQSHRTKVGHSFIKGSMREHDATFAGEHSGHYYFKDNFYADSGLIAALVVVQVLAESGQTMSQLAEEYRSRYSVIPETNFTVDDKDTALERIKQEFKDEKVDELDGVTVNFADGWISVRPSNTEPVLRLNAEAETTARLDEIVRQATEIITS